jgi:Membrane domain of glycerophosphoryl diester phosphodiesterase
MHEYTENTPPELQSFSAGRILKESWEICTKYFGALVMPTLLITTPCLAVAFLVDGKAGESLTRVLNGILGPIATMGVHRAILRLKNGGITPSFNGTFKEGNDYWWRGFKINFVTGLFSIPIIGIAVVLIFPGLMIWTKTKDAGAGLLLWIGILACVALITWFCSRACLVFPAMADGRTSASKAFSDGWKLTKGKTWSMVRFVLAITGMAIALMVGFILLGGIAVATELCTEDAAAALLMIPAFMTLVFGITYVNTATNLAYQSLKPMTSDERAALSA